MRGERERALWGVKIGGEGVVVRGVGVGGDHIQLLIRIVIKILRCLYVDKDGYTEWLLSWLVISPDY